MNGPEHHRRAEGRVVTVRKAGVYPDIPEADYHADTTALSASGAKMILRAPALFRHQQTHPKQSDRFDFGTAAHALVLGSGMEAVYVAPFNDWVRRKGPDGGTQYTTDERRIARDDGLSPILPEDWLKVCDMADVLAAHKQAMELLADGRPEISLYAEDVTTGVMRRGRLDFLRDDGVISDYKSTACADPQVFARASVAQFGYHISEANYRYLAAVNGIQVPAFALICQEKDPPYLVEVIELDAPAVERGDELMARACQVFAHCTATGDWPGYTGRPFTTVSLPGWAFYDDADDTDPYTDLESA